MADLPNNSLHSVVSNDIGRYSLQLNVRNKFDAVVAVIHCVFKQLGFECVGTGDSDDENASKPFIPPSWNQSSETWSLRYKHSKSSSRFTLKSLKMDTLLFVHIKSSSSDKVHSVEVNVSKFINDANFDPANFKASFSDLNGLIDLVKNDIIGNVVPSGNTSTTNDSQTNNNNHRVTYPDDPLRIGPPKRPRMPNPDYDDGFGTNPSPFGIGSGDLYPSMPGIPGMGGPGGNLIGPGSFQPYTPPTFGPMGGGGIGGGGRGGRNPPGVPPPGARFDPFTPFDPRGRRGFDPDPDIERPPHNDDFYS